MIDFQGQSWRVERGFLESGIANKAAKQAEKLFDTRPGYVEEFSPDGRTWEEGSLTVLRVIIDEIRQPRDKQRFSQLLQAAAIVNHAAADIAGSSLRCENTSIFLNFYESEAETGLHRDTYAAATVAVGLNGSAWAEIHLPDDSPEMGVMLWPSDALLFDNTLPLEERPVHNVRCTAMSGRIAIVNATDMELSLPHTQTNNWHS